MSRLSTCATATGTSADFAFFGSLQATSSSRTPAMDMNVRAVVAEYRGAPETAISIIVGASIV